MKIAYLVDRFPLISETFVLAQITGMIDRGHEVRIFANRAGRGVVRHAEVDRYGLQARTTVIPAVSKSLWDRVLPAFRALQTARRNGRLGAALCTLNPMRFGRDAANLKLLLKAAPYLDAETFDILHCQFGQLGTDIPALQRCGVIDAMLVTSFRGTDAMKIASRDPSRFGSLFTEGPIFLCVSEAVRQRIVDLGCPPEKTRILRSGIDLDRFPFRGHAALHDPVRIVSIGRLAPNKGIEFGIRAIKQVVDAGRRVEYRVLGNGPCRESLESLRSDLDLDDIVFFEGAVDAQRVAQALDVSDILIVPSITGPDGEQEGLPNSPKEAMAVGVPVIATAIGGIPELVSDGESGFLVEERDPEALAARLISLIDAWPDIGGLVKAARSRIENEFDIGKLNDQLQSVYGSLAQ